MRTHTLVAAIAGFSLAQAGDTNAYAQAPPRQRITPGMLSQPPAQDSVALPTASAPATPVATIDRARINRILGGSINKVRINRATGVSDVPVDAGPVTVAKGDFVIAKLSDSAKVVKASSIETPGSLGALSKAAAAIETGSTTYALPYRLLTVDSAGVERLLVPFLILRNGALTYDVMRRLYKGTAFVGVEDTLHPADGPAPLTRALQVLLATKSGGSVSPHRMNVMHTSLEYDSVTIESPDSTSILLRTSGDITGVNIPIPVRAIVASIVPDQRSIQGFGLATTELTVSLPRGLSRSDTAVLTFNSTGAPVKPTRLRLAGGDAGTLKLRSGMPGPDSIRAYIDGIPVAETVVTIKRPWPFITATLLGVLLGAAARWSTRRRKSLKSLGGEILRGFPFGFITSAALSVGLTLLPVNVEDPSAWVGVMVTAALGTWLGSALLKRLMPAASS